MAGPFPGMDPYIESQGNWQDFHNRLITEMSQRPGCSIARRLALAWTSPDESNDPNTVSHRDPEEIRQTWLEIRRLPDLESGDGRRDALPGQQGLAGPAELSGEA